MKEIEEKHFAEKGRICTCIDPMTGDKVTMDLSTKGPQNGTGRTKLKTPLRNTAKQIKQCWDQNVTISTRDPHPKAMGHEKGEES